ncbi:hypothetical protein DERP_008946 [Dermatophagoides pteronyssinus]|uniref:Uncharacterized protein n=1 Tax=Dermatophagoides pteronyssinus TaxID=6956 RepID=A0ABQ8JNV4_DERPT|nr:hypothetical protein DERP_008946 [Dermatophagoides pteronyssinus]
MVRKSKNFFPMNDGGYISDIPPLPLPTTTTYLEKKKYQKLIFKNMVFNFLKNKSKHTPPIESKENYSYS